MRLSTSRTVFTSFVFAVFAGQATMQGQQPRGYVTTPSELAIVADKANRGVQPYSDAVLSIKNFANTASSKPRKSKDDPAFWPYGKIEAEPTCDGPHTPEFVWKGSPLVEAKAIVYLLTHNSAYAEDVRRHLLELSGASGFGGEVYDRQGTCVLNLSWYLPGWIIAADLIEGSPNWNSADKRRFQTWLATEAYKKVDFASDRRSNNWGSAGSATAAMIADYLSGSGILMVDRDGKTIDARNAYGEHRQHQLDRINGNSYMDHKPICVGSENQGIRPDGGIPWELGRGSAGCDGQWVVEEDRSWTYMQTHLEGTILHAELLLRRGDRSLYDNIKADGGGSIRKAILFLLHNPNNPKMSFRWFDGHRPTLAIAYRYYRDPYMAVELGIGTKDAFVGRESGQMVHFGTITHGFEAGANPGMPPVTPPPTP